MKNTTLIIFLVSCFLFLSTTFAYDEIPEDTILRLAIQKKVDSWFQSGAYATMGATLKVIDTQLLTYKDNERIKYHFDRAKIYLSRMQKTVANSSEQLSPAGFLKTFGKYISSTVDEQDKEILQNCISRYDVVDRVAKRENFPTALILATWRKESSCRVVNPSNGDGLFQIVAHDYPATTVYQLKNLVWSGVYTQSGDFLGSGRLVSGQNLVSTGMFAGPQRIPFVQSGNILEEQVMDFINFSRAKWKWYDSLQLYDEIALSLSYDHIDLLSLRKHAILYNGFAKGRHPENSFYANQNFGWNYEKKQDGLVVMYLRVLRGLQDMR